jgi:uncharacterized protein
MTTGSIALDTSACWRLLGTVEVGRLCYTEAALPVVRPVPFMVENGVCVVVALSLAVTPSQVFARPTIVAFEAGEWQPSEHRGWSVQLVGRALAVHEPDTARFAERGLMAWIGGGAALYVRVADGVVAGQRVMVSRDAGQGVGGCR